MHFKEMYGSTLP